VIWQEVGGVGRYDDAVKALCAFDLSGLCAWLGVPTEGAPRAVRLAESLSPLTTREVDLLVSVDDATVLHVEFQTHPEKRFAQRMLEYWLRLEGSEPLKGREIVQHAVLLGPGRLTAGLTRRRLDYSYEVHRLCDADPERLLADPALVPFAALARMPEHRRGAALAQALSIVAALDDPHHRERLARATIDLAAIRLTSATISRAWEESDMPIPSLTNRLYQEGRDEGVIETIASLLRVRFGDDDRIGSIAARLAHLGPIRAIRTADRASTLDDLA
jgi:hypothetical protein